MKFEYEGFGLGLGLEDLREIPLPLRQQGFKDCAVPRQFWNWLFKHHEDVVLSIIESRMKFEDTGIDTPDHTLVEDCGNFFAFFKDTFDKADPEATIIHTRDGSITTDLNLLYTGPVSTSFEIFRLFSIPPLPKGDTAEDLATPSICVLAWAAGLSQYRVRPIDYEGGGAGTLTIGGTPAIYAGFSSSYSSPIFYSTGSQIASKRHSSAGASYAVLDSEGDPFPNVINLTGGQSVFITTSSAAGAVYEIVEVSPFVFRGFSRALGSEGARLSGSFFVARSGGVDVYDFPKAAEDMLEPSAYKVDEVLSPSPTFWLETSEHAVLVTIFDSGANKYFYRLFVGSRFTYFDFESPYRVFLKGNRLWYKNSDNRWFHSGYLL